MGIHRCRGVKTGQILRVLYIKIEYLTSTVYYEQCYVEQEVRSRRYFIRV